MIIRSRAAVIELNSEAAKAVSSKVEGNKVKKTFAVVVLTWFAAACGGNSTPTGPSGQLSVTGTWAGTATDSSTSASAGTVMGQASMGGMTWPLTQSGSTVTGAMNFAGMAGRTPGSLSGTMSGEDMAFTMDMPVNSMMSSGCSARATGTAHFNGTSMTMTGTYTGTNSYTGAFTSGQMAMTRR